MKNEMRNQKLWTTPKLMLLQSHHVTSGATVGDPEKRVIYIVATSGCDAIYSPSNEGQTVCSSLASAGGCDGCS